MLLSGLIANARTTLINLAWDEPSPNTGVVAYRLFWGQSSKPLTNSMTVFDLKATVRANANTSYTFFCVALGSDGRASGPSNFLSYHTPKR